MGCNRGIIFPTFQEKPQEPNADVHEATQVDSSSSRRASIYSTARLLPDFETEGLEVRRPRSSVDSFWHSLVPQRENKHQEPSPVELEFDASKNANALSLPDIPLPKVSPRRVIKAGISGPESELEIHRNIVLIPDHALERHDTSASSTFIMWSGSVTRLRTIVEEEEPDDEVCAEDPSER